MSTQWFEAFRQDPKMAVADLFTGRAGTGSSMRLDVPELLRLWFPPTLADERAQLDDALLAWLTEMQESYALQVERLGFSVYGKRVGDALIALQLLDLPQARGEIRKNMDAWLRWLSPLRLAPERDPALECFRLLTHGQPDGRHITTWLRLAGDRRAEYLTVALAGLQLLPNGGDSRKNQVLMLQALLHHATTAFHDVNEARPFFNRRFGALRGLYPRGPQHWQQVLEEALPRFRRQVHTPLAEDLAGDLRESHRTKDKRPRPSGHRAPVQKDVWNALLIDIRNPSKRKQATELLRRLFKVLERNDDYASETGDSFPFVRTLCNLGSEMLKRHALGMSDMDRLGVMIERALLWEPANPYCWMLWAQWHQVQGQRDAEEAILREMLRMFPRNVPSHVELARLLIRRGEANWREAEHYLQRAMDQDPNDGHVYVVAAHLQSLRGRLEEAKATLAGFLARNPENRGALNFFRQLQAGQTTSPDDTPRNASQGHDAGGDLASPTGALREVLDRGRLAAEFSRARFVQSSTTPLIEQESLLGNALAGFYSQWLRLEGTPECPPHAWAWSACQIWQERAAPEVWRNMAANFPEAARETHFLRALAWPDSSDDGHLQDRQWLESGTDARAVDVLIRQLGKVWEQLVADSETGQSERDDAACAVMACVATQNIEFSGDAALRI